MIEKTLQEQLKTAFQKTNKEDWIKAAAQEVKTDNPFESLQWGEHGLTFLPIYDKNDHRDLDYLNAFNLKAQNSHTGARRWLNLPIVSAVDEKKANAIALNHLSQGADGILFDIDNRVPDFSKLLELIDWPFCSVSFMLSDDLAINDLKKYILKKEYDPSTLFGTLFWKKIPSSVESFVRQFEQENKFNCLGIVVSPTSPVEEISSALASAVTLVDALSEKNINTEIIIRNISFSLPTATNFFVEIAKTKTLRMLWFQVAQAYGVRNYSHNDLHIHTRSEPWLNETYQPHGNMLKGTSSAMAAVIGGCDSLTVYAEDMDNVMMNRIAKNVSSILLDETHLNVVADPLAGSYAVDNLIHELAQKAWREFVSRV